MMNRQVDSFVGVIVTGTASPSTAVVQYAEIARPELHDTGSVVPLPGSAKNSRLDVDTSPRTLVTCAGGTARTACAITCARVLPWSLPALFANSARLTTGPCATAVLVSHTKSATSATIMAGLRLETRILTEVPLI